MLPAYIDDLNPGFVLTGSSRNVSLLEPMSGPPKVPVRSSLDKGSLLLGLLWTGASPGLDLDLHVGLEGASETLSFRNPRTGFGTLVKQWGTGFERVSFETGEIDPQRVRVAVNLYGGTVPAEGARAEVRAAYAGQLFRLPVEFTPGTQGNSGKTNSASHWVTVDLGRLVQGR